MATLRENVGTYRNGNQNNGGLLSKLQIGTNLYDIKDPAVEALADAIETRLSAVEGKTWTAVNKGAETKKFATVVEQDANGAITVTYDNLRDTALTDAATTGQFITSVSQDVNGVVTTTKSGVDAANVVFTPDANFAVTSTTVQSALEDALAKALALKGTSGDESSADTIAAAKKYAEELVNNLAGENWSENAKKVQEIIEELGGEGNEWSTLVDKLKGMSVSEKGTQGQPGYRPANDDPTVLEYVQAAIEDVNATNAQGIADLDAVIYGDDGAAGASGSAADENYAGDTTHKVAIKVTEVDGKITAVDVKTNDVASAQALTTLDNKAVKSVNSKTPTAGAVTLYASDVNLSDSDNTTIAAKLTALSNDKANKSAISKGTITEWGTPQYTAGSETLAWSSSSVSVFVPNSNNL